MIRNVSSPSCDSRRRVHAQSARRSLRLLGDRQDPVAVDPHELESLAVVVDPTPGIDLLLDMLDDPRTPPAIAATIRDWIDS